MTNSEQAIREILNNHKTRCYDEDYGDMVIKVDSFVDVLSDLHALISEGYVAKEEHEKLATATNGLMLTIKELRAKYDELLQQRDELKEALMRLLQACDDEGWNNDGQDWEEQELARAAIKNTCDSCG